MLRRLVLFFFFWMNKICISIQTKYPNTPARKLEHSSSHQTIRNQTQIKELQMCPIQKNHKLKNNTTTHQRKKRASSPIRCLVFSWPPVLSASVAVVFWSSISVLLFVLISCCFSIFCFIILLFLFCFLG
jgi:uncharacterized membrane protein